MHERSPQAGLAGRQETAGAGGELARCRVTEEFERRVAGLLGAPDAVAVSSGTAALHLALIVTGVGRGDEVIVPSMTFCATIQAILAVGARPVFVDVESATLCVIDQLVMEAITDRTRAVMPVLFGGRAIDFSRVRKELTARNIVIVEDAAHAFGSRNGTRGVGTTGDLTCFSFGPIKNLTCGQGGMVIPRSSEEADTLRQLRLLGVVQAQAERANITIYRVETFGLRYQLSGTNAAIGVTQLAHFETTERVRRDLWRTYQSALSALQDVTPVDVDPDRSVPHLCQVRVKARDAVFTHLRSQGMGVGVR